MVEFAALFRCLPRERWPDEWGYSVSSRQLTRATVEEGDGRPDKSGLSSVRLASILAMMLC
jgi:hypothetical protein